MPVVAVFQGPSLTQEQYEESVRRLTDGKTRLESPADWRSARRERPIQLRHSCAYSFPWGLLRVKNRSPSDDLLLRGLDVLRGSGRR
jgi:hypothetical protein